MPTERLDHDDAYTTRFRARIIGAGAHRGRPAVELESTYFYPESGGQEADRGTLGGRAVVDVQVGDEGRVWHVLGDDAPLPTGELEGEVDWGRRFDHMQQHTGQHILSAALERVLGAPTLSSHLGAERSTIEVPLADASWRDAERAEQAANRIVWNDLEVVRHWADDETVKRFALRKATAVTGRIRIVEIPDWDVSACGGTHTRRTGEVGAIKIVRWEKVRGNVRFEFLCGARALRDHGWRTESMVEAAKRRTMGDREVIAHLERAAGERDDLQQRLGALNAERVAMEARARVGVPPRAVADYAAVRRREDVRLFALKCLEAGARWVVAGAAAPEPCVVAGRAKGAHGDLRALVPALLERTGGKGGGAPEMVQASAADPTAAERGFRWLEEAVREAVEGA